MSITPEMHARQTPRRPRLKVWQWYIAVSFLLGGVLGFASYNGFSWTSLPAPVVLIVSALVIGAAMVCSVLWMRDIDELARQAHYEAWFWGGGYTLCLLMFLVLAAPALPNFVDFDAVERLLSPMAGSGSGFLAGVATSLLVLTTGYSAWWLVFWLRKH